MASTGSRVNVMCKGGALVIRLEGGTDSRVYPSIGRRCNLSTEPVVLDVEIYPI